MLFVQLKDEGTVYTVRIFNHKKFPSPQEVTKRIEHFGPGEPTNRHYLYRIPGKLRLRSILDLDASSFYLNFLNTYIFLGKKLIFQFGFERNNTEEFFKMQHVPFGFIEKYSTIPSHRIFFLLFYQIVDQEHSTNETMI